MKKNKTIIKAQSGKQEIFITREFDFPAELVFKLYTDPQLITEWLGGQCDLTLRIESFNAQPGGLYRYTHTDPNGKEYGFHGVFHGCVASQLIVRTFEFECLPEKGHAALEIVRFEALPNKRTKMVIHYIFQSVTDRDRVLQAGMATGISDSHARLDNLIENYYVKEVN